MIRRMYKIFLHYEYIVIKIVCKIRKFVNNYRYINNINIMKLQLNL